MSASSKKKLRKEQNATQVAEKQKAAQKENRKLKITSTIFICVLVAILLVGVSVFVTKTISRSAIQERKTIALTLNDDHKLNSIMMSYYYIDTLENQMNNNSTSLMLMGLDFTKPLNEQEYEKEMTWADYFVNLAATRARDEYALCLAAEKAEFALPKDYEDLLTSALTEKELSAQLSYGFADLDAYLSAYYCNGANTKSYTEYLRTGLMAEAFYTAYGESLEYTDEDRRAHDKDKEYEYSSFSYASYFVSYTNFLPEGVTVADATDDQKQAALDAAKAATDSLTAATTEEELDTLIAALSYNKDKETPPTSNKNSEIRYAGISTNLQSWIAASERVEGDMTVIANETTTTDADGNEKKTTSGYTVVRFKSSYDNEQKLANVRHLLVAFEGGTYDSTTGVTTYTDEEKATAKAAAEKLLEEWKSGEATEESFIELVKKNTDDTASAETGGLYEDIAPNSSYVANFLNWAISKDRQIGNVDIVETEYGYHIMYFSSFSDRTYRDALIDAELMTADVEAWYAENTEVVTMEIGNTKHLNTAIILQSAE